jgi:hypothetical protein
VDGTGSRLSTLSNKPATVLAKLDAVGASAFRSGHDGERVAYNFRDPAFFGARLRIGNHAVTPIVGLLAGWPGARKRSCPMASFEQLEGGEIPGYGARR